MVATSRVPTNDGGLVAGSIAHLREHGFGYREHLGVAWRIGWTLLRGGAACLMHGVAPALFRTTGSDTVRRLHTEFSKRRCTTEPNWLEYEI